MATTLRPAALSHLVATMEDRTLPESIRIEAAKLLLEHCSAKLDDLRLQNQAKEDGTR